MRTGEYAGKDLVTCGPEMETVLGLEGQEDDLPHSSGMGAGHRLQDGEGTAGRFRGRPVYWLEAYAPSAAARTGPCPQRDVVEAGLWSDRQGR